MEAITACCWTLLRPGDELIYDGVYGCTFIHFHHGLAHFGVKITHVDLFVGGWRQPMDKHHLVVKTAELIPTPFDRYSPPWRDCHRHQALLLVDRRCARYLRWRRAALKRRYRGASATDINGRRLHRRNQR